MTRKMENRKSKMPGTALWSAAAKLPPWFRGAGFRLRRKLELFSIFPFLFSGLFLCPSPAHAQITFDAGSGGQEGINTNSVTFSHTCSGSNRILFVGISNIDTTPADRVVSNITYASVSLTKIDATDAGNQRSELWYLIAPATGANDVVVIMGVGATLRIWPVAVSFTGVAQSSPVEASSTATGTSSAAASIDVATVTDNAWVIDMLNNGNTTPSVGAGQTIRAQSPSGTPKQGGSSTEGPVSPAGTTTMSWSFSGSTTWAIVAAAFRPAPTTAPPRRPPIVWE